MLALLGAFLAKGGWSSPHVDYHALAPEIVLTGVAILILLVDLFIDETRKYIITTIAGAGLALSAIPVLTLAHSGHERVMFGGGYVVDKYSLLLKGLFLVAGYIVLLMSSNYLAEGDYYEGEYSFLLVCSLLGMVVMTSARDLISIFIALETLSIPAYLLAGWRKRDLKSNEAMMKYYLLGVVASTIMLYGMSLLYGITGATELHAVSEGLNGKPIGIVAIFMVICGFAFKVSAVPFHQWAPDTYEGAPTPITAFLSVASKAAGFVALTQLIFVGFLGRAHVWQPIFWILAVLTMVVGNLIALRQTNIVRMLAYSSIAQAGFILAPFAVAGENGTSSKSAFNAISMYLIVYTLMNHGAFSMVIGISRKTRSGEISSLGGLFSYAPFPAVMMTLFMFSLAGIPPLGGFWAKFYVFKAAINSGLGIAAVIGLVGSVVAAFYYLRLIKVMWFDSKADQATDAPPVEARAIAISAALFSFPLVLGALVFIDPLAKTAAAALGLQ